MTASDTQLKSRSETHQAWWVYLLRCADQSLYCGITNCLDKRLRQHNGELKGGARYTQARRPCVLVFQEAHDSRSLACRREYEIKQLSRAEKQGLFVSEES
jgi:putative endonuclease